MRQAGAGLSGGSSWIPRCVLVMSILAAAACSDTNLEDSAPSGDAGTPFELSTPPTASATQTLPPATALSTTAAPQTTVAPPQTPPPTTAPPPQTTVAPPQTPPPTTAPPPTTQLPPPQPDAAQIVRNDIEGNLFLFTWREPGRPIYGWLDIIYVWYCSDGTVVHEASGQRTTVLDNIEYRSYSERGVWRVTGNGSLVAIEHANNLGVFFTLWIEVGFNRLDLGEGWTAQVQGPAGC